MTLSFLTASSQCEARATACCRYLCPAILPEQHGGGCLGWSAPPRRPGSGAFTRKVARWDSTGSKPGTTHVAKHLHPILAEDQRIHTAEEIFEHSEYEEISIHLVTHTREIPP